MNENTMSQLEANLLNEQKKEISACLAELKPDLDGVSDSVFAKIEHNFSLPGSLLVFPTLKPDAYLKNDLLIDFFKRLWVSERSDADACLICSACRQSSEKKKSTLRIA